MNKIVLFVLLNTLTISVWGQRTCATTDILLQNKTAEQLHSEQENFENWLIGKRSQIHAENALQGLNETTIYQIPVVVHIVHTGEDYGIGYNITDEQIESQIAVLTRDFRHLNPDSVNTPANFQPLMADIGFEFVLAKRTPDGLPTNGITRTNGNNSSWSFSNNASLKSISYWNSNDYLNLWVAPLSSGLLGWAEFPTSDTLDGLNGVAVNNPLTDGVVVTTRAFGSKELYPAGNYHSNFDLGRTTTHEMGHYFGLRHISGDGNCTVDDFVTDTPTTKAQYLNCPSEGTTTNSCVFEEPSMFMNYMDYVDDQCMNLFSQGQKDRMLIVVNNSPRRASLLTSLALEEPPTLDAAIVEILSPEIGTCDDHIYPSVTIKNTGMVTLTSIEMSISVNNMVTEVISFPITLTSNQDTVLSFTDFFLADFGTTIFSSSIISVNGIEDNLVENNIITKQIFFSEIVTSLDENFTAWPQTWAIRTDAPVSEWNFSRAPNIENENKAAVLTYYQNDSPFIDELISPILDLSSYSDPYLRFDYAYGEINFFKDELAVVVSVDCGNNFLDTLYIKSGNELATTEIPVNFVPSGPVDWRSVSIDLSAYTSQPIQLAFIGNSDGGNNIYLDNFLVTEGDYEDLSIKGLVNESGAISSITSTIGLIIENSGTTLITEVELNIKEDAVDAFNQIFSNLNLLPGERYVLEVENNFTSGIHELGFYLLKTDANLGNSEYITSANFLPTVQPIPFRGYFNDSEWNSLNDWTINSRGDDSGWQLWPQTNDYIFYPAYSQGNAGLHDWLVLPQFDFTQSNYASLQYKIAYASNEFNNELVRVRASINGGKSFDFILETLTASEMTTHYSNTDWSPQAEDDWQTRFIDLSLYTSHDDMLIAFEVIDGDGNNVYLDEIELFVSNEPSQVDLETEKMAIYPNPTTDIYTNMSFNLAEKQDVIIRILDVNGKIISNQRFTNILNQTLAIELGTSRNGIYIIHTIGADFSEVTRILVNR